MTSDSRRRKHENMPHPFLRAGFFVLVTAALIAAPLAGCAATGTHAAVPEEVESRLAGVPEITPASLDQALALIKPQEGESRFDEISWLPTLLEGRREAAARGKPIVAFMMSGHPKGCT